MIILFDPKKFAPLAASTQIGYAMPHQPLNEINRNKYIILSKEVLEVKLPTIWTDEKQRREESERREE